MKRSAPPKRRPFKDPIERFKRFVEECDGCKKRRQKLQKLFGGGVKGG